jgi:hypothetical protein
MNQSLRNEYLVLYEIDQQAASSHDNLRTQDSIFYELSISVSKLIKEYGFPHWMINNKDTIIPKLYVMLRHYCGLENRIKADETMQADSLYCNMKNEIPMLVNQALNDGWILPDAFVDITTYWDDTNPYGKIAIVIDFEEEQVSLSLKNSPEKQDEINKRRDSIGLFQIKEFTEEMLKTTWYKDYPFHEIINACINCDTCTINRDFIKIIYAIAGEVKFENKRLNANANHFIFPDFDIRDQYFIGFKRLKNKKHTNDIDN